MGKLFTSKQFVERFKWLVNDVPNKYYSGKLWLDYDKSDGKFRMDCVLSVKGIFWGFTANKNKDRGGAVYKSNGVGDFSCNGALDYCSDVSTNFKHLVAGEYLCMKGLISDKKPVNHTGIYLGNGKVFECTSCRTWGVKKCIISDIDSQGTRSYKGKKCLRWTYHGKLKWVDYSDEPQPINQVKILQTKLNEQFKCGLTEDGIFGVKTKQACAKHYLQYNNSYRIMNKWLQQRLIDLGYSCGKSGADGYFGKDTKKAVVNFQKSRHLNPDGIVGQYTYQALTE